MTEKTKKIIIYSGLISNHSWIKSMAQKHGMEVATVDTGDGVFDRVKTELPNFVLLDVSMPGKNGIECALAIKEFSSWVKVILISSVHSLSIQDSAKKARVDLFAVDSVASVKVPEFIEAMLQKKELPPDVSENIEREVLSRRGAPRFPFEGEVQYQMGDEWSSGVFVNVSLDGLLFQTKEPVHIGQKLTLSWMDQGEKHVEIFAIVVRQIESQHPQYPYLIGVQFFETPPSLDRTITEFSEDMADIQTATQIEMELDLIQEILTKGDKFFQNLFQGGKAPLLLENTMTNIVEFERISFRNKDEYSLCIRELVGSRIACQLVENSSDQLKSADASMEGYVGRLISMTTALLFKIEELETESDDLVKKSIQDNKYSERHQLNETSNRLYQAKASMLKTVSQKTKKSLLSEDYKDEFNHIVQKNKQMTSYQEHMDQILKEEAEEMKELEAKRTQKVSERIFEESEPKPEKKQVQWLEEISKRGSALPVAALMLLIAVVYPWATDQIKVNLSSQNLSLFVRPRSMELKTKDSLEIDVAKDSWDVLGSKGHGLVLDQVEVYLTRKKLHQCKIVDGDQLIAAVYGTTDEKKQAYSHHIFIESPEPEKNTKQKR